MYPSKLLALPANLRAVPWIMRGVLLFAFVVVVLSATMPAIERQLTTWRLLPAEQSLTELYFDNPSNLTSSYQPNEPLMLRFTIVNHGELSGSYHFTITESNTELTTTRTLTNGSVYIAKNGMTRLDKTVFPADQGPHVYISIMVNTVTIGYWVRKG